MNRLRLFGLCLGITVGLAALTPINMLAWDGAEDEYLYIIKHLFANKSTSEKDTSANGRADNFDSAGMEYLEISKRRSSNGEDNEDARPLRDRVTQSYVASTGKDGVHPC